MPQEKPNLTQEELLWKIYQSCEKTRKYILWGRVMNVVYLLILIAPVIFAIIYLPPLIEKTIGPYKELLQTSQGTGNILQQIDLESLMKMYK